MEILRQYALSVIAMSVLCGVVLMLFRSGPNEAAVKMITGLMVTITVVGPFLKNPGISLNAFWENIAVDSTQAVREGETAAKDTVSAYITEAMESYICTKAENMGVCISAEVKLQSGGVQLPEEVTLTGKIAPYSKKRLAEIIHTDLGISEDKQIWIIRN